MALPSIFNSMNLVFREVQINDILQSNEDAQKYGLALTSKDAQEIVEARDQVLQNYGRIELDAEITGKIIRSFCSSPHINQEDYLTTIKDLQEIFYYMKNETEEQIGDEELLVIMRDFFENSCRGSIELLQGRELEEYVREVRRSNQIKEASL